ncbi:TNF receptor-associated factor homolog 1b-like [Telopea speciosissima]|uniref:TNF receptor-associated factor homolog 1b-like n=1 Tax=Telopea speciosissima TaxID=54955 RepID=UPI001CC4ABFD|nr:TNF receptor-associated factor homolog 1b-like [Telopea speciosissima]XP_043713299.1 TNF receptor-associated factor homolog 1b-like [Telopea speciosissima]
MAGSVSEEYGAGRSSEGISSGQRCQSGEALAEWRSSEQVENGTPSTSPPYWDTDDDDDCGLKPSELYGKFTWKIENFSQINKRELRSNAFEVGGYKWYILIYPQGCDVCNHLSLFLCVANHDKLLPGWSHFAQFTIAVVNKEPKKSKYSDTLHRFWKKEHDWGWKKFMELSKVQDGFIVGDTLVIKAQVQVIRERADRPFRCLDCLYRRELVRVYLTNVEQICRRFVEERRGKLGKLIEDKVRWSSFCAFWLGVDQNARRRMSREKTDVILKVVVKHFFIEKEVTSTLVMDSLYSGLKALEGQSKSKKGRTKQSENEETPAPIVRVEKDIFILGDDVLLLLERAALEPLPPKDEKGPQNRTKDGSSGEDSNKDSIERDERRLTELGRRTVEIFVLAHIFSNSIEVAYQEAVALKRQEELIREEEAAGQAESEQKAKRGAAEKDKRSKKKQAKQRRSCRKGKDRERDEKPNVAVQDKHQQQSNTDERTVDIPEKQARSVLEQPDVLEDVSDISDIGDCVAESQLDLEDRDANPVNWDTDASEIHAVTEASSSGMSSLPVHNGRVEKKSPSVMDDSSSTCSTDSIPSVVMNGPCRGNSSPNFKSQTSPGRGKNRHGKETQDQTSWGHEDNQPSDPTSDSVPQNDASDSCTALEPEPESEAVVESLKDRIQWLEQHLVEKEEEVSSLQKKLSVKDQDDVEIPVKQSTTVESSVSSPSSPSINFGQPKSVAESTAPAEPVPVRETSSNSPRQMEKGVPQITQASQIPDLSKLEVQRPVSSSKMAMLPAEKPTAQQVSSMSRPSSAPLIPGPRPTAPIVSMIQTPPSLARSVSAAGRLGTDPSSTTHSYVPHSYRNAIMGKTVSASTAGFVPRHSNSIANPSPAFSQPQSLMASSPMHSPQFSTEKDQGMVGSDFTFGTFTPEILQNRPQWMEECSRRDANSALCSPSLLNGIQNLDFYGSGSRGSRTYFSEELPAGLSSRQAQGSSADEFPHLDIINYLLDEEHSMGKAAKASAVFHGTNNGHHHPLSRQLSFPSDMSMSMDMGPSVNCCRLDRPSSSGYSEDGMQRMYGSPGSHFDGPRDVIPHGVSGYSNGQIDGVMRNQWPLGVVDSSMLSMRNAEGDVYPFQPPDYSNLACGVNGYTVFRPSNGH